ncbi:peptidoglycan-binding protein [Streptomyces sp. NPDC087440]|uniref:peptidoglycan-binding protein n=1 Tax=Streptomyces sp. NPDC087440 TaxID=3365790 RepID=UPI0038074F99
MTTTLYPGATRGSHWYGDQYTGDLMDPNALVVHTTEGPTLVSYGNGSSAPNITARPNIPQKRLEWVQHFAFDRSARALVNQPGGVETNTNNVIQLELIGTCDPKHRLTWGKLKAGIDYIYWPAAPDWALDDLAVFFAWQHKNNGIPLVAPTEWPAYPSSYGNTTARMTFSEWNAFKGICGHLHAPENNHGDPGNIPIQRLLDLAKAKAKGSTGNGGQKPKPVPPFPGADRFGPGKTNAHIALLGQQLVRKNFGKHYVSGPGPRWTDADRDNVRDFQRSRAELRGDADGLPGPRTWQLLFS